MRCDCNTQTGLAAIDGRACLLCGPEAPTFGRCRNAKKSAPRNEFMSYPLESRFRKRSPRGGGTFHRYRHCRRTGLASTCIKYYQLKKARDRKSVVYGKSVSVSVDLGGSRIIKKQKYIPHIISYTYTQVQ